MIESDVKEYIEKVRSIENEIEILKQDLKEVDQDFKDRLDISSVKRAIRILKIREKGDEDLIESVLSILEKQVVN